MVNRTDLTGDPTLILALKATGLQREKAVRYLITQHLGFIYKLQCELGIAEETLKDLYTDAILSVIEQVEQGMFRGESKLSSYLFRIFYFKAVDYLRKHAPGKSMIGYVPELPEFRESIPENNTIYAKLEQEDQRHRITRVFGQMSPFYRKLLEDYYLHGLGVQEIAQRLGEPNVQKISKLKYRGLAQFKKLWSQQMAGFSLSA